MKSCTHLYVAMPKTGGLESTTLTAHAMATIALVTVWVTRFLYSFGRVMRISLAVLGKLEIYNCNAHFMIYDVDGVSYG